jgi:hypothetical protein
MKKNILIAIVVAIVVVLAVSVFTLGKTTPAAKPVTDTTPATQNPVVNQIFEYSTIDEVGYGVIGDAICYIDESKNIRLFTKNNGKTIKKLSFETARIISNGSSCLVDIINENDFNSFLLTQDLTIKQYEGVSTRPLLNSENYQICSDENCFLIDSNGTTVKTFSVDNAYSTPDKNNAFFEITGYNEEYIAGELLFVAGSKKTPVANIDRPILSLHANKNMALLSMESNQHSVSILTSAETGQKYTLSDVDPSSIAIAAEGFVYASKSGDIADTNQANNIYQLTESGERRLILGSNKNTEDQIFNINNMVYNSKDGIIYWQDAEKVFSIPFE